MMRKIANWGNFPVVSGEERIATSEEEVRKLLEIVSAPVIPRGMGKSYGDASLGGHMISSLGLDYILSFDDQEGIIECESGVSLDQILEIIVPRGWFLPVTPGTKYITVGGAVASDVHGKNHHVEGSFCDHVLQMKIMLSSGEVATCSSAIRPELFEVVRGGMGLTGFILSAKFRLKKIETSYIREVQVKAGNFQELLDLFSEYQGYTYTMAWIDCLKTGKDFGRGILIAGEHAQPDDLSGQQQKEKLKVFSNPLFTFPGYLPSFVLNKYSVGTFNFLYFHKNIRHLAHRIIPYDPFFYPLDKITDWNRGYGKKGFLQYQFVLPSESTQQGMTEILSRISRKGMGSFLAVFKIFGKQNGLIGFPMEGSTLALDFPVREELFPFLDELDRIVIDFGGRLYLTKDARMKPETFWRSYRNAYRFYDLIRRYNPDYKFRSLLSDRLQITG